MDKAGVSSEGLLEFMKVLEGQELLVTSRQDPYLRTHPLTRDRVEFIENHVKEAGIPKGSLPDAWKTRYDRIRAKLYGFLENPGRTLQRYPETTTAPAEQYGRAIALYRLGETQKAIQLVDGLLATAPNDPYYLELKGQILFESGDPDAAIPPYEQSVAQAPKDAPLYLGLARALIARGHDSDFTKAEEALEHALRLEPNTAQNWRNLAIARGRMGKEGEAAYAMAEYTLRTGQFSKAKFHAGKAVKELPSGSPARLRAEDIEAEAQRQLDIARKANANR